MTAAEGQHPAWCAADGCAARGWHASLRLLVHSDAVTTGQDLRASEPAATVRLVQLTAGDAEPHLVLTGPRTLIGDGDEGPGMLLSIRQTRILRRFMARLVQETDR